MTMVTGRSVRRPQVEVQYLQAAGIEPGKGDMLTAKRIFSKDIRYEVAYFQCPCVWAS